MPDKLPGLTDIGGKSQFKELTREDYDLLMRLYLKIRIESQFDFYQDRIREFDANAGFMVTVSALIMAVSAFLAALGATAQSPGIAFITAILPALAAFVSSFRQLYQWERQSNVYRDAALGLEEALLIVPDDDEITEATGEKIYARLVRNTEKVLEAEVNQWGQIAMGEVEDRDEEETTAKPATPAGLATAVAAPSATTPDTLQAGLVAPAPEVADKLVEPDIAVAQAPEIQSVALDSPLPEPEGESEDAGVATGAAGFLREPRQEIDYDFDADSDSDLPASGFGSG